MTLAEATENYNDAIAEANGYLETLKAARATGQRKETIEWFEYNYNRSLHQSEICADILKGVQRLAA